MASHKNSTGLAKLVKGIQNAVIKAQQLMRRQHLDQMDEYIDKDGNAICIDVKIPVPGTGGGVQEVKVPKMVLAPPSNLKLEKLEMEFDVKLQGLQEGEDDDEDHDVRIHMSGGMFGRSTKAKCKIVFKGDDPPEGYMRLNDELLKYF